LHSINLECSQSLRVLALANGWTTKAAAQMFGVSTARISQLRQWPKESWEAFQGQIQAQPTRMAAA
jgi:transposase